MKKKPDVLLQLKAERSNNILKLIDWSMADFDEMQDTYLKAKEVALDSDDREAAVILDEKLSQLAEARQVKSKSASDASA